MDSGPYGLGYVLNDVRHSGYNFAKEIKIIRVYVCLKTDEGKKEWHSFTLGSDSLERIREPHKIKPADAKLVTGEEFPPERLPPQVPLGTYKPLLGLSATFMTKKNLFSENNQRLRLTQRYLFTEYSNKPSHEPSAVLRAARLYPLLYFQYWEEKGDREDNERKPKKWLSELRVDYQFHLVIDEETDKVTKDTSAASPKNQAGIFSDQDAKPKFPIDIIKGATSVITSNMDIVFKKAEKPLVYEVVADGLREGHSAEWDNIHQWAYRDLNIRAQVIRPFQDPVLPSTSPSPVKIFPLSLQEFGDTPITPGAFHAIHTHWRWSAIAHQRETLPSGRISPGGEHFKGLGKPGGPLLDPDNPVQTIRFAITTKDRADSIVNSHEEDFAKLFKSSKYSKPEYIGKGKDIVIWVSITVHNLDSHRDWHGVTYAHGLYFAHDKELSDEWAIFGARNPFFIPDKRPEQRWDRHSQQKKQ